MKLAFIDFVVVFDSSSDYPTQYNSNRNPSQPKYVQTTYRPSTVTTQTQSTSTKNVVPQRESYISNSKPTYEQSVPAHEAYNPEYDEALVAQVSDVKCFLFLRLMRNIKQIFLKKNILQKIDVLCVKHFLVNSIRS